MRISERSQSELRRSVISTTFLLLMLGISGIGARLQACPCEETPAFEEALKEANVVVRGTVLDVTTNPINTGLKVTLKVNRSWKRTIEHTVTISTPTPAQCGYDFRIGETYLVYVNKKFNLKTSSCDRTRALIQADSDLELLGEGYAPSASPGAKLFSILMLVMTLLGLLFVAFVVLRKRIFKRAAA